MVDTGYARTMARMQAIQAPRPERPATSTDWTTLAVLRAPFITDQPLSAYVACKVDADPGATGEIRMRPALTPVGTFPTATYFNDFPTAGSSSVLGAEWEIYDSPGNAGFGLRRPAQISVVNEATATSNGKALQIVSQNVGGVHQSGGLKLKVPHTYGQYEVRVRCSDDATQVTSGVVLLWPQTNQWPRDGEIDWWESYANRNTRTPTETNVHRLNPTATGPTYTGADDQLVVARTWSGVDQSDWHKIVGSWSPGQLSLEYDNLGNNVLTSDPSYIPDWPMELCIQLDAWSATPPASPVTMQVDYVLIRPMANGVSASATVTGYATNVPLGWTPIGNAAQLVYIEGRRTSTAGGIRLIDVAGSLMATPPDPF